MESKHISELLKRYEAGETSLQEEAILRDYFMKAEDLPPAWQPYGSFFAYYSMAKKEAFPQNQIKKPIVFQSWMAAAAMIAIIITTFLATHPEKNNSHLSQAKVNLAFEQFQSNIKLLSNHLNRGTQQLAYLDYWNETTQKLIK